MGGFRLDSISPYDPGRDPDSSGSKKRKERQHPDSQGPQEEDVVILSDQAEAGNEPVEDTFTRSETVDAADPLAAEKGV